MQNNNPQPKEQIQVGVFDSLAAADHAVGRLFEAGYSKAQVSIICSDHATSDVLHYEANVRSETTPEDRSMDAAKEGSLFGGAVGALGGFAMALGVVGTAGMGILVAGPVLAVSTAGGAVVGTLINEMRMRGIETESAQFYDQAVKNGKILVAVDVGQNGDLHKTAQAQQILKEEHAQVVELHAD